MEYIQGHCITNLDDYDVSLVNRFYSVPNIGDRVMCRYKGNNVTLKVVGIIHSLGTDIQPYIIVELNK